MSVKDKLSRGRWYLLCMPAFIFGIGMFGSDWGSGLPAWVVAQPVRAAPQLLSSVEKRPATATTPIQSPTPGCELWDVVSSPNANSLDYHELHGVAAVATDDVWAVGQYGYIDWGFGCCNRTLIEHWDGNQWSIVPSPNPVMGDNRLLGVVATSADDVWAVGFSDAGIVSPAQSLIAHWDGSQWSTVASPNPGANGNILAGAVVISANDVWAVGSYSSGSGAAQTLVVHWDGTQWSVVSSPNTQLATNRLYSIAATSADDMWAVGSYAESFSSPRRTLTMHWDGTEWSIVPSPTTGSSDSILNGVAALSANDAWAVGYSYGSNLFQALVIHWDGANWSTIPTPNLANASLSGVAAVSTSDVWAVGGISGGSQAVIEHWNGTNWSVIPGPNPSAWLWAVAMISPNNVWATGAYFDRNTLLTRVAHYTGIRCCTIEFVDVLPADYFYEAVRYLYCQGAISGYLDGTFRPGYNATRGQLCKILVLAYAWPIYIPPNPTFSDVPAGHPFYQFIETAHSQGIISGYADGRFRPDNNITRGQLCKIVVLAAGWPIYTPPIPTFMDVSTDHPFYLYIETAYSRNVISGYSDGTFRPGNNATRGQLGKIIYNALKAPR